MRHVPNALPHRDDIRAEIYGTEGIPEEDMIAHELKLQGKEGVLSFWMTLCATCTPLLVCTSIRTETLYYHCDLVPCVARGCHGNMPTTLYTCVRMWQL